MTKITPIADDALPVAKALHKILTERNLSQAQVSIGADLGRDYLRDLFRGKNQNPGSAAIHQLADYLGVDLIGLSEIGAVPSDEGRREATDSEETRGLLDLWELLNDEGRDEVLSYIGRMIGRHPRKK